MINFKIELNFLRKIKLKALTSECIYHRLCSEMYFIFLKFVSKLMIYRIIWIHIYGLMEIQNHTEISIKLTKALIMDHKNIDWHKQQTWAHFATLAEIIFSPLTKLSTIATNHLYIQCSVWRIVAIERIHFVHFTSLYCIKCICECWLFHWWDVIWYSIHKSYTITQTTLHFVCEKWPMNKHFSSD